VDLATPPPEVPPQSSTAPARRRRRGRGDGWIAVPLLAPALGFFAAFVYLPAGISLALGFFHYQLFSGQITFAGWTNFRDALSDPLFRRAVGNSLLFAAMLIPTTVLGAVALAILLAAPTRWYHAVRTVVLLPYVTPVVATSIGWLWLYDPSYGLLNLVLGWLHLPPSGWLLSPGMALPAVALYTLWHNLGLDTLVVLAAMASLPGPLAEAAAVDGASAGQVLRHITLPLISPTLFFLTVTTTIGSLQAFAQVYSLSGGQGGPEDATTTLILLIYQTAFQYLHLSYAAAMATFLVVLIVALTLAQTLLARRWVFYQ
jgi:ABC-type sugar transport system permease subunit